MIRLQHPCSLSGTLAWQLRSHQPTPAASAHLTDTRPRCTASWIAAAAAAAALLSSLIRKWLLSQASFEAFLLHPDVDWVSPAQLHLLPRHSGGRQAGRQDDFSGA